LIDRLIGWLIDSFIIVIYLPSNTTIAYALSTSMQFRRAEQQGQTRTPAGALKRLIKQLLGTYSNTQVKYYEQTRKLEKSIFSMLFLIYLI